jgi:hypothetical protein
MDIFMPYRLKKMTNILNEIKYSVRIFDPILGQEYSYLIFEEDIPKGITLNEYIENIYFYKVNRSHIYGNFNTILKKNK